jgi:hypothetical protein
MVAVAGFAAGEQGGEQQPTQQRQAAFRRNAMSHTGSHRVTNSAHRFV